MRQENLNKLFKENQLGSIADTSIAPITPLYSLSDVKSMFKSNSELNAIPVETDDGYGLVFRDDVSGKNLSIFDDKIEKYVKNVKHFYKATENVFQVANRILEDADDHRNNVYIVFHKKSYLGLVSFMDLMIYVNQLKALDERRAREIQQFLIDKNSFNDLPYKVLPFNRMASSLGGDFYRISKISENLSLISIFDVSGKGVSGALSTISLSSFFSLFSLRNQEDMTPQWVVQAMNHYIYDQTPFGVFITAILMFVDLENRKIEIFNMGHTRVLSYRIGDDSVLPRTIDSQLPPLGIDDELPDLSDSCVELKISSDLKIVLYSDGLSDAANDFGVMFGEERITDFFLNNIGSDSGEVMENLQQEIDAFIKDAPLTDDITVLLTDFSALDLPLSQSDEIFVDNIQFPFHRSFDYSLNLYLNQTGGGGEKMVKHHLLYLSEDERFLLFREGDEGGYAGYLLAEDRAVYFESGQIRETLGLDTPLFGTFLRPYHIKVDWFYRIFPLKEGPVQKDKELNALKHFICHIDKEAFGVKSVDIMVNVTHRVPFRMTLKRENAVSRMSSSKWVLFNGETFPKEFSIYDSTDEERRMKVFLSHYKKENFQKELFNEENLTAIDFSGLSKK